MDHRWVEAPEGHEYCKTCGLLEHLASLNSECSGQHGVADEAEGWG